MLRLHLPDPSGERVSDHISRKELKQDKIKETIEHGAEAVISHGQFTLIIVILVLAIALGYGGWRFYIDRQTAEAPIGLDDAMKTYQTPTTLAPDPLKPNDPHYPDQQPPANHPLQKFT